MDVPRTAPEIPWMRAPPVAAALERLLFVRAVRSSAAGYVQGIADLVVPFLTVFLSERACAGVHADDASWAAHLGGGSLSAAQSAGLADAEADCYWCAAFLLDGIQDNYTFAQLGIQKAVHTLGALVRRLDAPLAAHMEAQGVDCLQFAFRWVNCLLQREFHGVGLVARLWDTYLAEGGGLSAFLPFLMAALLLRYAPQLMQMDFQGMLLLLQHLPTAGWSEDDLCELLSQAHQHRSRFAGAASHLLPP